MLQESLQLVQESLQLLKEPLQLLHTVAAGVTAVAAIATAVAAGVTVVAAGVTAVVAGTDCWASQVSDKDDTWEVVAVVTNERKNKQNVRLVFTLTNGRWRGRALFAVVVRSCTLCYAC